MERSHFWANDSDSAASETNDRETSWKNTPAMNSLSFYFLATAILILMFLIMAIFERLRRTTPHYEPDQTTAAARHSEMQHSEQYFPAKKMDDSLQVTGSIALDLFVMMPGLQCPTHLAKPAPLPCPREGMHWPSNALVCP